MRIIIAIFTICFMLTGCSELGEPVSDRVDEISLLGRWTLKNSPRGPAGRPELQYDPNGAIVLDKEGVCVLENLTLEMTKIREGSAPIISWIEVNGTGTWRQQEWRRSGGGGQWSIEIVIDGGEAAKFAIWKSDDRSMTLTYRPDPEMAEPFVFGLEKP